MSIANVILVTSPPTNLSGMTPLFYCFERMGSRENKFENTHMIKMMALVLLECGADINYQKPGRPKECTVLLKIINKYGKANALDSFDYGLISFLVEKGADTSMVCLDEARKGKI